MKKNFSTPLLSLLGLAISFSAVAQQADGSLASNRRGTPGNTSHYTALPEKMAVSSILEKGFAKEYPQAVSPNWAMLDAGFQASFIQAGQKTTAIFKEDGKLSYAITQLKPENLPTEVQQFIKKEYPESKLIQAISIKDNSRTISQTILENGSKYIKIKASGEDMEVSTLNSATR